MLGTHQRSAVLQRENSIVQPIRQILKDFMENEEGFLSTKYVNILKKYYTEEFAEKLFVLHGVLLNSSATLGLDENLSRRRFLSTSLIPEISSESRFYSIATSAASCGKEYESEVAALGEGGELSHLRMNELVHSALQDPSEELIHRATRMYSDDNLLRTGSISREFMRLLRAGQERLEAPEGLASRPNREGVGKIVKAMVGNELGIIFFARRGSGRDHWFKPCVYNVEHISSIRRSGTASTLQAFFHMNNVSGYDGATTLNKLLDDTL